MSRLVCTAMCCAFTMCLILASTLMRSHVDMGHVDMRIAVRENVFVERGSQLFESSKCVGKKNDWLAEALKPFHGNAVSILQLVFCENVKCDPTSILTEQFNDVTALDVADFMTQASPSTYDVIVCVDMFARVIDPVKVFQKVSDVLRSPGGTLLATSPFSGGFRPKSGPPILAKHGDLWFKKWARATGLVVTGVWSEGTFAEYLQELSQRAVSCSSPPGSCSCVNELFERAVPCCFVPQGRSSFHTGFMVRLERGSGKENEEIKAMPSNGLPPCMLAERPPQWRNTDTAKGFHAFQNLGNPGTRDHWIAEKARELCAGRGAGGERLRILDVSAGNRPYRSLFEKSGCQYFSNEFAGNAIIIDDFRDETEKHLSMHDYLGPDVTNTTAPSSHFDIVMLTEVLEHVPDALAAIRELRRVAKKGGNILLTSPLTSGPHQLPFHFASGYSGYWYAAVAKLLRLAVVSNGPQGDVYALLSQECGLAAPPATPDSAFRSATFSPEHAIGWLAHLRKE